MSAERLLEVARRLDELAGDGESELQTISEELGELADKWPQPLPKEEAPRWAEAMRSLIMRALMDEPALLRQVQEELYLRESRFGYGMQAQMAARYQPVLANPGDISKLIGV